MTESQGYKRLTSPRSLTNHPDKSDFQHLLIDNLSYQLMGNRELIEVGQYFISVKIKKNHLN